MPVGAVVVRVPPQVLAELLATVSPVGSVSLNPTAVKAAVFAGGLVIVKVSFVVALRAMLVGLKALAIAGGATTVSTAVLLVAPVPPSVDVTASVVLLLLPALVPVTSAEKVHDEPAAGDAVSVPPVRLMVLLPAVAVIVPLPQEPVNPLGVATTKPAGKLSVKATPLSELVVFGLVMVKLSVLLAFNATLVGLKALLIVVGWITGYAAGTSGTLVAEEFGDGPRRLVFLDALATIESSAATAINETRVIIRTLRMLTGGVACFIFFLSSKLRHR
jgi:hypothetical protein